MSATALAVGAGAAVAGCGSTRVVSVEARGRTILADISEAASPGANSAALNAAIEDSLSTGSDVRLNGGEYRHEGFTLPPDGRVNVHGAGRGLTFLRNVGTNPSITAHGVPGRSTYMSDWSLSEMTLTADQRRPEQPAVSVQLASLFAVRDISILDHGIGVRHESAWDCLYEGVSVGQSDIAWLFPVTNYAPSSPVNLQNCSGWNCGTAILIENGVEALEWIGGDLAGCGRGLVALGNNTHAVTFHGMNFERIQDEDIVVGDDVTGPAALSLHGCRFLREVKSGTSVRFVRGDALAFYSCRWNNYEKGIVQGAGSGQLVQTASSSVGVDEFLTLENRVLPAAAFSATRGGQAVQLSIEGRSVLPAVTGTEGVATKLLTGPGRRGVTDDDFGVPPAPGCMCVLHDQTDGSMRHAIRGADGWHVSTPYQPPG